jgi:hypothetical protein
MKRGGRKTLLTKPLSRKIERLLAQGHSIAVVCQTVGIGERTYYQWCERNPQFAQATTRAIGKSKIALVNKLRRSDDWRASAFLLERRFPVEFGRCAERELPVAQDEKRINVAFILTEPDGRQRRTTWEEARRMVAIAGKQKEIESHADSTPFDDNDATEPNGEQPLP